MKQVMKIWGVGPKLFVMAVPYLILTSFLSGQYPRVFTMYYFSPNVLRTLGAVLLLFGLVFLTASQLTLFQEFKKGKLITSGTYSVCRNPIYASFIIFIIPALAFLKGSWLLLTASGVIYAIFKKNIKKEYDYLRNLFGQEYLDYESRVNELFPLPKVKKRISKKD